jgi:hypothetical protein
MLSLNTSLWAAECKTAIDFSKKCTLTLNEVHPTQFVVGMVSINLKKIKLAEKFKERTLKKYLKKKWAPSVIGPDGYYYITDRHHLTRSIYEAKIPLKNKIIYTKVSADLREKSFDEFYKYMKDNKFVYLKKTGQEERDIEDLPKHISYLENDRFRSLSWIVREKGGYDKVDVLFLEFLWADYLYRMGVRIKDEIISDEVINISIKYVALEDASDLPGFIPATFN